MEHLAPDFLTTSIETLPFSEAFKDMARENNFSNLEEILASTGVQLSQKPLFTYHVHRELVAYLTKARAITLFKVN